MLPYLTEYLLDNWQEYFPFKKKPVDLDYLGILGSHEGGKISFLAFEKGNSKPFFVAKVLQNNDCLNRIMNESKVLSYLKTLGNFTYCFFPEVLLNKDFSGTRILVETIIDGNAMVPKAGKNEFPEEKKLNKDSEMAFNSLLELNSKIAVKKKISDDFIFNYIYPRVNSFKDIFSLNSTENYFLESIINTFNNGGFINLCLLHGDFCAQNILVNHSKIGLIDWDLSRNNSMPLSDLFNFLINYYLRLSKDGTKCDFIDCFRKTFFDINEYSIFVYKSVNYYCGKIGLKQCFIKPLFVFFLLEMSVIEYDNLLMLSERGFIPFIDGYQRHKGTNNSYIEKMKDELWVNFFRLMVENEDKFIF